MTRADRIHAALIGAYVADAAALGVHWLYDPARIAAVAAGNTPAFLDPDPAHFEGFKGVFVHPRKRAGDLSHYGAHMRVAVQSMIATGAFGATDFQDRFAATFGAGGSWVGYIDKATKGTLANLAADRRDPSGSDDDQIPALAKLPPLMANDAITGAQVDAAIATTNANETAAAWSRPAAALLRAVYGGASVREALDTAIAATEGEVATALRAAIGTSEDDTVAFAGEVGRACSLPQSLPVIFHIAARAGGYREAVERNILAGGDNCGRGPVLGALFGAAHGIGGQGVPLGWIGRLNDVTDLTTEIDALTA